VPSAERKDVRKSFHVLSSVLGTLLIKDSHFGKVRREDCGIAVHHLEFGGGSDVAGLEEIFGRAS
jgi:hypothetical protein